MKIFVIKLASGEYLTECRLTSNYLEYERTIHREAASQLNAFDSLLVLRRLKMLGKKEAVREDVEDYTI